MAIKAEAMAAFRERLKHRIKCDIISYKDWAKMNKATEKVQYASVAIDNIDLGDEIHTFITRTGDEAGRWGEVVAIEKFACGPGFYVKDEKDGLPWSKEVARLLEKKNEFRIDASKFPCRVGYIHQDEIAGLAKKKKRRGFEWL
jgi:hypothetical protein